jgi:RNA polymerase sigma-70 factor (ECF subfamily)
MTELNDFMLVKDCMKGNTKSFEAIIDKYQRPIFNVAMRMLNNYDDAQDITQSVFVKAFENLSNFNPKFKFFSWIYRMAVNESINFLNQKKRHDGLDPNILSKEKTPEENFNDIEMSQRIQDALMYLPIDYRAVVILRHFEDFSYKEMSFILNISEKTVKSRLFTARQLLKDILAKKGILIHD